MSSSLRRKPTSRRRRTPTRRTISGPPLSSSRTSGSSVTGGRKESAMPKLPLPPEADQLLRKANPAVIATLRKDGSPHTAVTWYAWDGNRVLTNMDATRVRLGHMRRDPRVSLTVLDAQSWYRQLTVFGRVVEIREDPDFADADKLSLRYTRQPFGDRTRQRVSAEIELDRWYGWEAASPWPPKS